MRRYFANSLRSNLQPWQLIIHHYFTGRSEKLGSGVVVDNYIKPFGISWLGDLVQKVAPGVFTRSQECRYKRRVQNNVAVPLRSREQRIALMQKSLYAADAYDNFTVQGLLRHMRSLQNIDAVPPSNKGLYRDVVGEVARSVVNVSVTEDVYGLPITNNNGSGVIVNVNGTILTAFDLVANQWGWFQRQWTPKGQITVGLLDGRRVDANLVVANKDLGIAVLRIDNQRQLSAAVVGHITESNLLVNVEWLPTCKNALLGNIWSESRDIIYMYHKGFINSYDSNKVSFGGPIVDPICHVVGISQKKPQKDAGFIAAVPIKNAMKMIKC